MDISLCDKFEVLNEKELCDFEGGLVYLAVPIGIGAYLLIRKMAENLQRK